MTEYRKSLSSSADIIKQEVILAFRIGRLHHQTYQLNSEPTLKLKPNNTLAAQICLVKLIIIQTQLL